MLSAVFFPIGVVFKLTPVCLLYCYCRYRAKIYLKKEANDWQSPAESSGSPPDKQPMQPNAKRDWLRGQYDVRLFVPFFLLVHSAGSKLTVRRAWITKSQGQTRELYSVLMRIRLDAPTKSRWVGCSDRVWTYRLNRAGRCHLIFV